MSDRVCAMCPKPLTWRQEKYCSRSCAGKGVPPATRAAAMRKAQAASNTKHWRRIFAELELLTREQAIRRAFWIGYHAHKMRELRERRKAATAA